MREVVDRAGRHWRAEVISQGRTSGYLNPKVHRPVVQFACLDGGLPRRYAALPGGRKALEDLSDAELMGLLEGSTAH
jgi:hypothetical protein